MGKPISFYNAQGVELKVTAANPLPVTVVNGITLDASDIEIGAVEIKDGASDQRAAVNSDGSLKVESDTPADNTSSGSIADVDEAVTVTVSKGRSSCGWQITGTWSGTIQFEFTIDNINWVSHPVSSGSDSVTSTTANGVFIGAIGAAQKVRVRASAWTSGTATINFSRSLGINAVRLTAPVPAGTNAIGKLAANSGVDIGDVDILSIAAGTNLIGNVGHGKTIKTVTGTVSVDTDIVAAVATKRIKVIAFSLISASTTSNTITFQSNASTALWTTPLQAISGTIAGSNLATSAPSFLFATVAGEKLTLDVSAAQNITYSVSYFDDDVS
jgi:hypothetical protein